MNFWIYIPAGVLGYVLYRAAPFIIRSFTSPLLALPGPPNPSLLWGQFKKIFAAENSVLQEQWVKEYGPNITYRGFLGANRLWTVDPRALNHILTHSLDYQKPAQARANLSFVLGNGVLITEGEQHRSQRRIMNPAFGPAQIRELTTIFVEKAAQLRDMWASELSESPNEVVKIDILSGLTKMTLDVIGLAGFNYRFDALGQTKETNELNDAFQTIFRADAQLTLRAVLGNAFPRIARRIPSERGRQVGRARDVMHRIGLQLVKDKKAAILAEKSGMEKKDLQGRDLLTLLLKANMATDIPDSQRLSDEDVLAQVPTFLVAGHETTSNGTTWALFALTQAPEVQKKLRNELFSISTDTPTMDELQSLPFLDAVVRETLRLHAPVASTVRMATKDDLIPVQTPYTDRYGNVLDHIKIGKGDMIMIPILAMNRWKQLWGDDAHEFKPERWEKLPDAVAEIPGVWGNMLTFLGGPRACIGYRFSLIEMKALLFTLVRSFEFELAVPPEDVGKRSTIVQRPIILSDREGGNYMPLLVKHYRPS